MATQQHIFLTIKCFILFLNFIYLSISLFLIALSTKCMNRVETICICRMYIVYGTRYSLTHLMNSGDIIVWANYTKHTPNYMQKTYRSYIFTDNVLRKYMSADFIWRVIRLCIAFTPFHTCECGVFDVTDLWTYKHDVMRLDFKNFYSEFMLWHAKALFKSIFSLFVCVECGKKWLKLMHQMKHNL